MKEIEFRMKTHFKVDILGRMGTEGGDGITIDDQSIPAWCNSDVLV